MTAPTIVVGAALANRPGNGGGAWVRLSFVLGLQRLGCRTFLIEQIDEDVCVGPDGAAAPFERSANLAWFREVAAGFGLSGRAALVLTDDGRSDGLPMDDLEAIAEDADLLVNLSGHLEYAPLAKRFRRKAFIDLDPGFTQLWHAAGDPAAYLDGHDDFFTVGENVGRPGCTIPSGGIAWRPMRQPVLLDEWPRTSGPRDVLTTVATWRGPFGSISHEGTRHGLKAHEFRRFVDLPAQAQQRFEIALDIDAADQQDRDLLSRSGWRVVDPGTVAGDPEAFRSYVQRSGAEFSVAKEMYVRTNSGWFSDRSACYLASGKPVLVQDTGFSRNLPVGEGLIAFSSLEEAAVGAASIARRYEEHARAARHIAEEHFDSDVVLGRMLAELGISP